MRDDEKETRVCKGFAHVCAEGGEVENVSKVTTMTMLYRPAYRKHSVAKAGEAEAWKGRDTPQICFPSKHPRTRGRTSSNEQY